MAFSYGPSKKVHKIEGMEIPQEFIETYKKILLQAAKKFFGEWVEFNPNERIVESLIISEIRNMLKYGHAYCPCRIERIREHICPCEPAKEELERDGICTCRMFIKPDVYLKKQQQKS